MKDIGFANWDLSSFFPKFRGEEYNGYFAALESASLELLETITAKSSLASGLSPDFSLEDFAEFLQRVQEVSAKLGHLISYMECFRAQDINNEEANEDNSRLDVLCARFRQVEIRVLAIFKGLSQDRLAELLALPSMAPVAYYLRRWHQEAGHTMSTDMESLAADLEVTGFNAWENLYENVIGKLTFELESGDGSVRTVPMAQKVSLLQDSDPVARRSALEASNKSIERVGDTIASCLNCISGHRLQLLKRRGIEHFLDNAVFESGLSRATLKAMMDSVEASWPMIRRYLSLKAQMCGQERIGFQDLMAPLTGKYVCDAESDDKVYTWEEGCALVREAFSQFSPDFGQFATMALENKWVESEARDGKSPGGFCTSSTTIAQSRIFMTYRGNYGDVSTLAHELGHAYHEWLVRDLPHFCHAYPMTLAETASTFAEQLLGDHLLSNPKLGRLERIDMLHRRLDDAATYLLNIPMRFLFEESLYEQRAQGELSVSRLKQLMLDTQKRVYGDTLLEDQLDPWFWASKGHFYITDVSFYNFPYIFGFLFSLGVYAMAREQGEAFLPTFRELLRSTGRNTCEAAGASVLHVDLTSRKFWEDSIALVQADLEAFERLVASMH